MEPSNVAFCVAAAFAAGAVNAIAGGGTLLSFPSLIAAGMPSIAANATSTVALVPGSLGAFWGYRREASRGWKELAFVGLPSLLGGWVGARAVLSVGEALFVRLVPWLIFAATALFLAQDLVEARRARRFEAAPVLRASHPAVLGCVQFAIAVYGGFFGAGIGILMLAAMGALGFRDIHQMNRLKNFAAVCINGIAAITFVVGGEVRWAFAFPMAIGAVLGGYAGAGAARRVGRAAVRRAVVVIGVSIGLVMLMRAS